MNQFNYQSIYAPYFKRFIAMKKGLGYVSLRIEWVILELDKFFMNKKIKTIGITKQQIDDWRATRINDAPGTLYTKYSVLSQFCKFMCKIGYDCYIPRLPKTPPKNGFTPHIFTSQEMTDIFIASDHLQLYDKHMSSALFMIPAIIRLLFGTGLRVSEALSLKNKDIDFEKACLYVRKSKNGEERIAPISETLVSVLREYLHYRDLMPIPHLNDDKRFFFISSNGSSCRSATVYKWFRKVLTMAGIPHLGDHKGPRVHDLRHSFAVHSLAKMDKSGLDLYYSLPLLSTCLGHKSLQSTERYVRLIAEKYHGILKDEKSLCNYIFPKINTIINNENN